MCNGDTGVVEWRKDEVADAGQSWPAVARTIVRASNIHVTCCRINRGLEKPCSSAARLAWMECVRRVDSPCIPVFKPCCHA